MKVEEKLNLLEHKIEKLAKTLEKTTNDLQKCLEDQKKLLKQLARETGLYSDGVSQEALKEINESLIYSKRIQHSMLPDPKNLTQIFNDKLLIYRPRDVVSGDFYWFERIRSGRQEHMVIVAADCTGHGVSGALMSMVSSNQLTNIIYYQNYIKPEKILARLDKAIKSELYRNSNSETERHDGLEAGVCVIDLDTMDMNFAGAGIPLYLVREGEFLTFQSSKLTIGSIEGTEKEAEQKFNTETISLNSGDRLFMASDGFKDQFGGEGDKKFMSKRLHDLLLETCKLESMVDQESAIKEALDNWMGSTAQTDDILLLGVEV